MKSHIETSRLFVTADKHNEGVYFARTNKTFFARFYQGKYGWEIWIYPWKLRQRARSLTETFDIIDKLFKKYWKETKECQ